MFTGIVEEIGHILSIRNSGKYMRLEISAKKVLENTVLGDSISVNGICLTVAELGSESFFSDVMPQTQRSSNAAAFAYKEEVNLERALCVGARMGGHYVTGHIDGTGRISEKKSEGNAILLRIEARSEMIRYIVNKGSVAVDGTSLTVAKTYENGFLVSLIPHTSEITVLGSKKPGDHVNIECDIIAKYIEKLMNGQNVTKNESITLEFLKDNGF